MMNTSGYFNNDFYNLFECYTQVTPVVERQLPSSTRQNVSLNNTNGYSFPEAKFCKVFIQRAGGGADLTYFGKVTGVESDDGEGNTIITAIDGEKRLNIITTKQNAQLRVIGTMGDIEDEFVTNMPPRFDSKTKEIIIIQVEAL